MTIFCCTFGLLYLQIEHYETIDLDEKSPESCQIRFNVLLSAMGFPPCGNNLFSAALEPSCMRLLQWNGALSYANAFHASRFWSLALLRNVWIVPSSLLSSIALISSRDVHLASTFLQYAE